MQRCHDPSMCSQFFLLLCLLSFLMSGCGERGDPKYRTYCVEHLSCDAEYTLSTSIDACESEWVQREGEANGAQCGIEFEYYFDCVVAGPSCAQPEQSCFALDQDYQRCLSDRQ